MAVVDASASLAAIGWCDARSASAEFATLRRAPGDNVGFTETGRYLFRKPASECAFLVDDEPLRDDPTDPSCWVWEPGFYAGEVTAELVLSGSTPITFLLDVSPDPAKLGRDELAGMVRDLLMEEPSLVFGTEPATNPTGHLRAADDPWVAFSRLRRYGPDFIRSIEPIKSRPRRTLHVRRDSVAPHRVRRIDRHTIHGILRGPGGTFLTQDSEERRQAQHVRLDVPSVEETVDSPANRAVLAMIRELLIRSRELRERLQSQVERERETDTRTALAARWPRRRQFLESVTAQLERIERSFPFSAVQRAEVTAAGLNAVSADSSYARAWGRGWRALRRGVDASESTERLWLTPSWQVYERWCFMRIGQLLNEQFSSWNWRRRVNPHRWEGSFGERRAELRLQPLFSTSDTELPSRWSISKEREPDVVLSVTSNDTTRFIVLDVKYRVSRANVLDAMTSTHIYQDSLRVGGRRPEATVLIVPRTSGAAWLAEPDFVRTHRVGIHQLSLGSEPTLPEIFKNLLES